MFLISLPFFVFIRQISINSVVYFLFFVYFLTVCITAALIISMVTVERNAAERYIGDFIFVSSVL